MLSKNTKKVQFTKGKDFSLSGTDYTGYFNIFEKNVYVGKSEQNVLLVPKDTTNSNIILSDNYFDRSVSDTLTVKNLTQNSFFEANEIINRNSLNQKIEFLYDNFLKIYNFTKLSSPFLPKNITNYVTVSGAVGASGDEFSYKIVPGDTTVLSADLSTFRFGKIDTVLRNRPKIINTIRTRFDDKYTIFLSAKSSIFTYEIFDDSSTFTFLTSSNKVDSNKEIFFDCIVSTDHDNSSTLFVADSGSNSLFKIDVSEITFKDRTGSRRFNLIKTVGGIGTSTTNFNVLKTITFENNNLFVYDEGDKIIKNFDQNLVFIKQYNNLKYFNNREIISLSVDSVENSLYILDTNYNVLVLDTNNFKKKDSYTFDVKLLDSGEIPRKILFSKNNSNIYYLQTDKSFYKFFKNRKTIVIGKYNFSGKNLSNDKSWDTTFTNWENAINPVASLFIWDGNPGGANSTNLQSVDLLDSNKDLDIITFFGREKIITLRESSNLINFLDSDDLNFYKKKQILLRNEYFNNITLNTAIYKLLYNLKLIGIAVNKKLFLRFNRGNLRFEKVESIVPDLINLKLLDTKNFYIGNNENISANNFNRCISNLLEYQNNLLQLLDINISNTKIPSLSTVTF
jgi:hypothetical protein